MEKELNSNNDNNANSSQIIKIKTKTSHTSKLIKKNIRKIIQLYSNFFNNFIIFKKIVGLFF